MRIKLFVVAILIYTGLNAWTVKANASVSGTYQSGPDSSGPTADPCDVSDLIAKASAIANQNSLAATDARQQFKQEFDARAAACEASKTAQQNAATASSSSDAGNVPQRASTVQDPSEDQPLNPGPKEDSPEKAAKAAQEMQKEVVDFFKSSKEAWGALKGEGSILGQLKQACEELGGSFEMAAEASSGQLPADTKSVEALKQYVEKQAAALGELAHRSPQDWLTLSGASDPASFASAQQRLDELSSQLAAIKAVAEHFMPIVKAAEKAGEDPTVLGIRFMAKPVTTIGLDPIALDWVWSQLSGSTTSIDTIQNNIRAARSAIQDEQARKEQEERARGPEKEDEKADTGANEDQTNWESRRNARQQQQDALMRQMNQIISSEPDEQRRHALLEDISQQLQHIHEEQKLDKKPQ